jgi:hypothetical protein
MTETKVAAVKNQNSVWGVQVPWTLGLCVTCRVLSFTTFRPVELRNLITWVQISSLGLFFTSTTLSFPFTAPQTRRNHRTARFQQTSITYTLYIRCIQHTRSWMFAISLSLSLSLALGILWSIPKCPLKCGWCPRTRCVVASNWGFCFWNFGRSISTNSLQKARPAHSSVKLALLDPPDAFSTTYMGKNTWWASPSMKISNCTNRTLTMTPTLALGNSLTYKNLNLSGQWKQLRQ